MTTVAPLVLTVSPLLDSMHFANPSFFSWSRTTIALKGCAFNEEGQRYSSPCTAGVDYQGVSQNLLQYALLDLLSVEHPHTVTIVYNLLHAREFHFPCSEDKKE